MSDTVPPPCNPEIFFKGSLLCWIDGKMWDIENWVVAVRERANAEVDWHYIGGQACVKHLGDAESLQRTLAVVKDLQHTLVGRFI